MSRTHCAFSLLFAVASVLAACELVQAEHAVMLLDDTRFARGFEVLSPVARPQAVVGTIRPDKAGAKSVWKLAQWDSRFNLADARPAILPNKAVRFFDGAKAVTFFPPGGEADISFALHGSTEYRGTPIRKGDAWAHLYAERGLVAHPTVGDLSALRLAVQYRLIRAEIKRPQLFDPAAHTAQFQTFLTVANCRPNSSAKGDYFWFGVQMYDVRHRFPPAFVAKDVGSDRKIATDKLIYSPPAQVFSDRSAHDRQWVSIDKDILPLIRDGLRTAWQRGFLDDSHDWADYCLAGLDIGWEVPGLVDAEMQVRGLKLEALYRNQPTRQASF
jgi:hypothetical protein